MAKGKNLNPADAHRKALRKKELKKAKRSKARDFALVKKDTTDLEEEVERLEFATAPKDKARYAEAKAELDRIYQKKEEYLKEHPEQRRLVYRKKDNTKPDEEIVLPSRNFFDKNGLPRHPERSIYYDPVMNPFGVAPPGMPYQERPRQPGEVYSDDSDDDDEDDDVAMPEGPPPEADEEDDSDDDIPMPAGPPPGQSMPTSSLPPPPPSLPPHPHAHPPPPLPIPPSASLPPRPSSIPPPPPPPGFPPNNLPPPSAWLPRSKLPPGLSSNWITSPRPLRIFRTSLLKDYLHRRQGFIHPRTERPVAALESANLMSATVFAAPELRDFKKEATAFVPSNVKRKKAAGASGASSSRVNAAPSLSSLPSKPGTAGTAAEESLPVRPDLLGSLKGKFGTPPTANTSAAATGKAKPKETQAAKGAKDDYDKFVESMADILGPK
ncbi:Proline-rich family protein [Mycena venus]|uniref:Proline-rich family protein n=1 Tax=Mycena venus TaxID=2733690 RepID=A0A8H6XVT9_9AGAR|nr:Proline-rich family protein [Mycena venus]